MKKILALSLALAMLLSLCSCYRAPDTQRPNTETETVTGDNGVLAGRIELSGDYCEDTTATAEFIQTSGNDFDINYQWYIDDVALEGETKTTCVVPINTAGKKMHFEVFDSKGVKIVSEKKEIAGAASSVHSFASMKNYIKVYGRSELLKSSISADWSGSGFEVNVQSNGGDMKVKYSGYYSTLAVIIDGSLVTRQVINKLVVSDYLVFNVPAGTHNVRVLKDTEIANAEQANFTFDTIEFDGEYLDKPADSNLLIEFLGAGVTCGDGVFGSFANYGYELKNHSFINSYAYKTAKALGADWSVVARENLGLVAKDGAYVANDLYKYINRYRSKTLAKNLRKPNVVVVELGENDIKATASEKKPEDTIYEALNTMINSIRAYAGDEVKIVYMSQIKSNYDVMMKLISKIYNPNNLYALYVEDGYGNGGSNPQGTYVCMPNAQEHSKLANTLSNFLKVECGIA